MERRWGISLAVAALFIAAVVILRDHSGNLWYRVGAGGCIALGLIGVYYLMLGLSMAAVLVRAVFALVPVGLFAGGLIYTVLQITTLDPRVAQGLIAAVVVAAGWIVGYMTSEWRRVSAEQERRRDVVRAAITELELIADHGRRADWDKVIADAQANFRKNARYDVFIFYGQQYITLKRLVDQIEVLRWGQIRSVMDIFQALDRLDRMETRMQSDAFAALPKTRREDALVRYLKIHGQIPGLAEGAVAALRDGPFHGWLRHLR